MRALWASPCARPYPATTTTASGHQSLRAQSVVYNRLVREDEPYYLHTDEGSDDMPSHAKSSLTGVSLTIPITNGRLNLGTWQGIYLCEFRDYGGARRMVATVVG